MTASLHGLIPQITAHTLGELVAQVDRALQAVIPESSQRQFERNWLLQATLGVTLNQIYTESACIVPSNSLQILQEKLEQRIIQRVPLQYLVGEANFMGHTFTVTPAVLIPRPETELLAERAIAEIEMHSYQSIVDVGTGSGCIAISIALACPEVAVIGVDCAADALTVAQQNVQRFWPENAPIQLRLGEWLAPLDEEKVDLIVSNPPYIDRNDAATLAPEVLHEPEQALFSPDSPQAVYQTLLEQAREHLTPGGQILLEVGAGQAEAVAQMATALGYTDVSIYADYAQIPRIIQARWEC